MRLRIARERLAWTQQQLSERAGLSRAEVSAIETGRVVPSAAIAIRLARALGTEVEALFGDERAEPEWAWPPAQSDARHWQAEIAGRVYRIPCESSLLGVVAHDRSSTPRARDTLLVAGCDPAIGLLAAPLLERGIRLVTVTRSSREALALLSDGRVHLAGVHLQKVALGRGHRVLKMAVWEEGLAERALSKQRSPRALARLAWASRPPGSGARECMEQLLEGAVPSKQNLALDHREVAAAIRSGWADVGVCIRLAAAEAGLAFRQVRREAYELCYREELEGDRRLAAVLEITRSRSFRATLGELPGYDARSTGELRIVA